MNLFVLPTNTCFGISTPLNDLEGYNKIYDIKGRGFEKPLAILIGDFDWLKENTNLTDEQIEFMKSYDKPFTILCDSDILKGLELPNIDLYKKVAFRVSHNFMHMKLIMKHGPLFLTSANRSGDPEIFTSNEIRETFKDEIEKYDIKVFARKDFSIDSEYKSSDIFYFTGEGLEIEYIRKN